jgi:hypothetical protein
MALLDGELSHERRCHAEACARLEAAEAAAEAAARTADGSARAAEEREALLREDSERLTQVRQPRSPPDARQSLPHMPTHATPHPTRAHTPPTTTTTHARIFHTHAAPPCAGAGGGALRDRACAARFGGRIGFCGQVPSHGVCDRAPGRRWPVAQRQRRQRARQPLRMGRQPWRRGCAAAHPSAAAQVRRAGAGSVALLQARRAGQPVGCRQHVDVLAVSP